MSELQPLHSAAIAPSFTIKNGNAATEPPPAGGVGERRPDLPSSQAGQPAEPGSDMPTVSRWEAETLGLPPTDYLRGIDSALRRWFSICGDFHPAAQRAQIRAIRSLVTECDRLFNQPQSVFDALPESVRWIIMDIGHAAQEVQAQQQCATDFRQPKHDVARADHLAARALLRGWIATALEASADRRLANSAQWVQQGLLRLTLVTLTGDAAERIRLAGMNPENDGAFFPDPDAGWSLYEEVPEPVYPFDTPERNDTVCLRRNSRGSYGWLDGKTLVITQRGVRLGRDNFWEALRHAVQQIAAGAGAGAIEQYQRTYRAFAYQENDKFSALDNSIANIEVVDPDDGEIRYRFTARQHAIFKTIHGQFSHTSAAWRDNPSVDAVAFRDAVAAYRDPDSKAVNRWHSPRIELLYHQLEALPPKTSTVTPAVKQLLRTCFLSQGTRIDGEDARTLLEDSAARIHWTRCVNDKALKRFTTEIERTSRGWKPWQRYIVGFFGL